MILPDAERGRACFFVIPLVFNADSLRFEGKIDRFAKLNGSILRLACDGKLLCDINRDRIGLHGISRAVGHEMLNADEPDFL